MRDLEPRKRKEQELVKVRMTKKIKTVLNIIDTLLAGRVFGQTNSANVIYLISCQARIEEMKEGNFTQDDLIFLNDTIDSLMDMLMAAKSELKFYIKEDE